MRALLMDKKKKTELPYLCFTSEQIGSRISLTKISSPTVVSLETSTDWETWSDYTFGTAINLASIWDKVYFRNKSETPTWFSTATSKYYYFTSNGKLSCSWDIGYLLCKNSTDTLTSDYCFYQLFSTTHITTSPRLPATTLTTWCYRNMFKDNTDLTSIPKLPATVLKQYCYYQMFQWCSKIKLAAAQDSDYTQAYRIPTTWTTTTEESWWNSYMFRSTWWTFTSNPTKDTTYYVHKDNTIV